MNTSAQQQQNIWIQHVCKDQILMSFEELRALFDVPQKHTTQKFYFGTFKKFGKATYTLYLMIKKPCQ